MMAASAILVSCSAASPPDPPPMRPPITEGETIPPAEVDRDALAEWVRAEGRRPVELLVEQFKSRDVIMIGEVHSTRQHQQLVIDVLEPLYRRAGVRAYCTEFARASQNDRLRAIVEASTWDEQAAVDFMRDGPWPTWGWREYVDLIKEVWRINSTRPEGEAPLRIVGIDDDWTQLGRMNADRRESFDQSLQREETMFQATKDAVTAHGPKVLVHVGAAHAVRHGIRLAERLHAEYGQRVTSVILHHNLNTRSGSSPIQTLLDEAVAAAGEVKPPVALPIAGSPMARVRDDELAPMMMLGPAAAFEDYAPAIVYFGPPDTMERGRWIKGFVTDYRFEEARELALRMKIIQEQEGSTPQQLDVLLAEKLGGPDK